MKEKSNHGGSRPNSGRLKKDELLSLIDTMDAIAVPNDVWSKLFDKIKDGDTNAIKTWLQYRYGMPKQTIDSNVQVTDFNLKDILKFDKS